MAPEVISSNSYTEKADVFSYGIILWEIASREPPYRSFFFFILYGFFFIYLFFFFLYKSG
jgi:serine/threonine protein kinase